MRKDTIFLSFRAIFCALLPPPPPNTPENKKMPKILSFYTCVPQMTIMMYGFWYIKDDRQDFFVILGYFLLFYPSSNPENLNFEKNQKSSWR